MCWKWFRVYDKGTDILDTVMDSISWLTFLANNCIQTSIILLGKETMKILM